MVWHSSPHLGSVAEKGKAGLGNALTTIDSIRNGCATTYHREGAAHGSEASGLAGLLEVGDCGQIRLGCDGCVRT